jgi:hypothetical protein
MTGRVGVHLEVVSLGRAASWPEHAGTQAHHVVVRGLEVLHPQVEMDLLRWCAVRPVRRDVVWHVLHPDARFSIDHHHVPVIVTVDLTAEHPGPERTLGLDVCGVEGNDLIPDVHVANVPHTPIEIVVVDSEPLHVPCAEGAFSPSGDWDHTAVTTLSQWSRGLGWGSSST